MLNLYYTKQFCMFYSEKLCTIFIFGQWHEPHPWQLSALPEPCFWRVRKEDPTGPQGPAGSMALTCVSLCPACGLSPTQPQQQPGLCLAAITDRRCQPGHHVIVSVTKNETQARDCFILRIPLAHSAYTHMCLQTFSYGTQDFCGKINTLTLKSPKSYSKKYLWLTGYTLVIHLGLSLKPIW